MENNHKIYGNVVGAPFLPVDSYTKKETDALLDKKVSKEDIVSAYRFCGSVDKFEDLPHRYALIPNGIPTFNGKPCGTYDEETHTVTVYETHLENHFDRINIPIVPITIRGGKYFTDRVYYGDAYIGSLYTYVCGAGGSSYQELSAGVIDQIELSAPYGDETMGGTTDHLGYLNKIADAWLIDKYDPNLPNIPKDAYDNGNVYNVLEDGMNYAWTGTDWDALGGEHKDLEARAEIESLRTFTNFELDYMFGEIGKNDARIGDIETALDSIIEIQNSLIGGDA